MHSNFYKIFCIKTDLRFALRRLAISAHNGTMPFRVLFTTNATALDAISLSSTKPLSSLALSVKRNIVK